MRKMTTDVKTKKVRRGSAKKWIFYWAIVALPLLQFILFYIGVNFNSLALAFKEYDYDLGEFVWSRNLADFRRALSDFFTREYMQTATKNSLIIYLLSTFIGLTLAIMFSFYIYKKGYGSGLFKVILYLPQIVSVTIIVLMFRYFVERGIPTLYETITGKQTEGLLSSLDTRFGTLLFFNVWVGFGTQVLMYTGTMSGISDSIVDAAKIDGMSSFQELWYVTIPSIWPTLTTFIVVGIAHFFTNQMQLFAFFGTTADYELYTLGYFLYRSVQSAGSVTEYSYLASFGIIFTLFAIPITFIARFLLEKLGPKTE